MNEWRKIHPSLKVPEERMSILNAESTRGKMQERTHERVKWKSEWQIASIPSINLRDIIIIFSINRNLIIFHFQIVLKYFPR